MRQSMYLTIPPEKHPLVSDNQNWVGLHFRGHPVVTNGHMKTGDYSILGYEDRVLFEWKRADDLLKCCVGPRHGEKPNEAERFRFRRQCERLGQMRAAWEDANMPSCIALVVGLSLGQLLRGDAAGFSQINPLSVWGTLRDWGMELKLPVIWAENPQDGADCIRILATQFARTHPLRRCEASQALIDLEESCRTLGLA